MQKIIQVIVSSVIMLVIAVPVFAASEDECAIWLCAPAGFTSDSCNGPKKAFRKRIRRGKSPLPSYSSCVGDSGDSSFSAKHTRVRLPCTKWDKKGNRCLEGGDKNAITVYDENGQKLGNAYLW